MSKREAINRYSLIVNKVRKGPASLQQIKDYLELQSEIEGYDYNISTRTFQRDLQDIRDILKVDIQYSPALKAYEIVDNEADLLNDRMLEAFDIFHALQLSEGMHQYINFEERKAQGSEYLYTCLHAIKNKQLLRFDYQKFDDDDITSRLAEPYALKEFKQRWYLLAKTQDEEKVKLYALDRIKGIDVTKKKFTYPKDFSVSKYFENCFGIIHEEGPLNDPIILSFTAQQGAYIKTLPLHNTQEILLENEEELRIQLRVHITYDLVMELMSYGDQVKVISPEGLATELKLLHQSAAKL